MAKQVNQDEQKRAHDMWQQFVRFQKSPTVREVEIEGVKHRDSRDIRQRILADGIRYPKKEIGTPLEQQIAAREAELAAKRWEAKINDPALSPEEKDLMRLKRQRDQELDAEEKATRDKRHAESPRTVKLVTEAKLLRERIVQDSSRELSEIDYADLVIRALLDSDADPQAANALLTQLRDTEAARISQAKLERQARIQGLYNEIEALERQAVKPAETDEDLEEKAAARSAATKAKLEAAKAEQAERYAKAMAAIDAGDYAAANELMGIANGDN